MSDVSEVVEEWTTGRKGLLVVGGIAAVVLYLWWGRQVNPPASGELPDDAGQDFTGSLPTGSGAPPPSPDPVPTARAATTNTGWLSAGVDWLVSRGVSAVAATNALSKLLSGEPTTTAEQGWIGVVLGAFGQPPEGMPPMTHAPGNGPTPAPPPPAQWRGPLVRKFAGPKLMSVKAPSGNMTWGQLVTYWYSNLPPDNGRVQAAAANLRAVNIGAFRRAGLYQHVGGGTVLTVPATLSA